MREADLRAEIESIEKFSVGVCKEKHTEGIFTVGTAFHGPLGRGIARSVPVPTTRFKEIQPELIRQLLAARGTMLETPSYPED